MVRPFNFRFNEQTAGNNKFQQESFEADVQVRAMKEFDDFVELLRSNKVEVTVVDDTETPETPDSIFPNNWVSFHEDGSVFLYPMFSENRRQERRNDILDQLKVSFLVDHIIDLSAFERSGVYLEGTGSLVLDRSNRIAYACRSIRTDENLVRNFCITSGYTPVLFDAVDANGFPIYHTNVMMCVGTHFAVICLDAIPDAGDLRNVFRSILSTGKEIIPIGMDQMNQFAGNMLEVKNTDGEALLIMSSQAYLSLSHPMISALEKHCKIPPRLL